MSKITPIKSAKTLMAEMPLGESLCRGYYHPWPILVPGKRVPRGFRATLQKDGCYQIVETCPQCGSKRTTTTLPGGASDPDAVRRIEHPDDWVVMPRNLTYVPTKRDYRDDVQEAALTSHFGNAS